MIWRAAWLCRTKRFTPAEAFRLGLFERNSPGNAAPACISRKHLTRIQKQLNPDSAATTVRNKAAFYRHCLAHDIPIPRLHAVFDAAAPGWRPDGNPLTGRQQWVRFITDDLPDEFVIKPTLGAYGRGLRLLTRTGTGFIDHAGQSCTAEQLHDAMADDGEFDGFVIQERLRNAPELIGLTGAEALQTVRLITLVTTDGDCRIVHGHFKPIIGDHVADNIIDGLTGNVEAPVRLADGVLGPANHIPASGKGPKTIYRHPTTGNEFAGFRLPMWADACQLVQSAGPHFRPLRTIGWDIALTPHGPIVVEGNVWWDPPNQHPNIGPLVSALQEEAP
jgi:hypothetical protein